MQARPADAPPVTIVSRLGLDTFLQHRQRFIPAGLAAFLVIVAALSALPVATPAPVSAGAPASRNPRIEIAGLAQPVEVPSAAEQVAASTDGRFVDSTITNVPRGDRSPVDATSLLKTYTVQDGDTAVDVASKFGISVSTLYWANRQVLKDPQSIWVGQTLMIPPANGILVTVGENDTLESLAAQYGATVQAIVETNGLSDPILLTGDVLFIPGATAEPMPTPTPAPTAKPTQQQTKTTTTVPSKPVTTTANGGGTVAAPYTGGRMVWPVMGGYISQRFWSGHPALDIAAPYGTGVKAAAAGTVIYAGWRSYSGGGNVIWISHGGLYTTYNHLSAWYVSAGQGVAAGQKIGAIGTSGIATGPHLHFEVWTVYPWSHYTTYGIQNPCYYLGC